MAARIESMHRQDIPEYPDVAIWKVLMKGIFDRRRFLDLIWNFIVDDGGSIIKKSAVYHQFHTVNRAVEYTLSACGIEIEFQKL